MTPVCNKPPAYTFLCRALTEHHNFLRYERCEHGTVQKSDVFNATQPEVRQEFGLVVVI
ncbi:hypothetical protein SAMN04488118_11140 [Epibacterium ulvae]|uniref:Uncharacterized protein n=1 Tax=Epibacterium ulvae TaxID=1156985 RepID=A0A1G5R9Y0_9RHOB|nr:hypothetical protein SAMN04488118_11140 [Epibacterium ulvae]